MRCPFCDKILSDDFIKRGGAFLMGKAATGKAKARSSDQARRAAMIGWAKRIRPFSDDEKINRKRSISAARAVFVATLKKPASASAAETDQPKFITLISIP
jgi:hypothetical protein